MKLSTDEKFALVKRRLKSLDRPLSDEQLDFILHSVDEACYLKACPGSGKTEVVGIKAAYEISEWKNIFAGLAVLSFTKNAAKEIADRVKLFGGNKAIQHPHFIGTIDSWLHGYFLHPFAHKSTKFDGKDGDKSYRLVDNEERYDFLNPYKTTISIQPYREAWVNEYYFECSEPPNLQAQNNQLNLEGVGDPIKETLQKNKRAFLDAGFTTYADAEFLCYYLLKKNPSILNNVVERFPIIMIDECQDLSHNQLEILKLLKQQGAIIHFIGDNNQSIYEFKKVYVDKIEAFVHDYNLKLKYLTQNFRSNQQIVNVCIGLEKCNTGKEANHVVGSEEAISLKSCLLWEYKANEISTLPQRFIDYVNNINLSVTKIESRIRFSKSGILARAHSTLSEFRSQPISDLTKIELFANALNCWTNKPRTGKDMQNALQQLGKSVSLLGYEGNGSHQNQYCPSFYSQIEWREQLFNLIEKSLDPSNGIYPFDDLTWSKWAGNLKTFLEVYWVNFRLPITDWTSVKGKIKSPKGTASKLVADTIKSRQNNYTEKLRMTTFHDVKGETLDAVLIVSAKNKRSKGGHFEQWLGIDNREKEYVRFAYVASSRPKHLLVWAIPKIANNESLEKIGALGFELE